IKFLLLLVFLSHAFELIDTLWTKSYGGKKNDYLFGLKELPKKGFVAIGEARSWGQGDADVWFLKLDTSGEVLLSKTFGTTGFDGGRDIVPTNDGGYLLLGSTPGKTNTRSDIWLVKIDSLGNKIWEKTYGDTAEETAFTLISLSNNELTICARYAETGVITSNGSNYGTLLINIDSVGNIKWSKKYVGITSYAVGAKPVVGEGFVFVGDKGSMNNAYCLRINSAGDTLWSNGSVGPSYAISPTSDKGFVITGYVSGYNSTINRYYRDVRLLKMDSTGKTIFSTSFGGTEAYYTAEGYGVVQLSDGGYLVCGYIESPIGDTWLLRMNQDGDTVWTKRTLSMMALPIKFIPISSGGFAMLGRTTIRGQDS
ncbi:MAG: hypothetical protein JNL74_12535, partial [Fibrobacteres bacterium]|nr:hypothetical protein [Fibrobacterota bacterium]